MKAKILFFMLVSGLLVLAAWLVRDPSPIHADEIPEKYRETVNKGLEYLVKQQGEDGHWEGDGGKHPVAMTGLAGIALLMERKNPRYEGGPLRMARDDPEWKYSAKVRKAVDWLLDRSKPGRDGLIFSEHPSETSRYMEGHGLAVIFLAGATEDERDKGRREKLIDVLTRGVKYIVKAQSTQGGWYHTSKVEGHDLDSISVTAIQIQALQAAENAGIPVPNATINDAQEYLKKAIAKYDAEAKTGRTGTRATDTAAMLACRYPQDQLGRGNEKDDLAKKWLEFCRAEIPVGHDMKLGRDELTHYYYAQVMRNFAVWNNYRTATFDQLQSTQNKDGSWPAGDGVGVGPVYSTAVWCIILQLDKRNHPSMRRIMVPFTTTFKPWSGGTVA